VKYNELTITKKKSSTRVGRGIAAGQGKTAGRGTKGQKSRTGYSKRPGFEGGQNPLMQRLPKLHGFKSHRPTVEIVTTGQLEKINQIKIDNEALAKAKLVSSPYTVVKVLLGGELSKKLTVSLQAASVTAIKSIEKAGGKFEVTEQIKRTPKEGKTKKPQASK